ncbi:hypothetical protein [Streptomyces sp. NPDC057250]|uniref:hypothetical protein n=1 Tax=Streptomyces sp. NPDC057250 TaxID=3346068 RepID=UPI0036275978
MLQATYSVSAVRVETDGEHRLLRFETTTDTAAAADLLTAYTADYADRSDVLIDLATTHGA